ncbi:hypothetical protein GH733_013125 [Mirounga leonina]|nr:hypothetical protein GH733_013125 [Mirounga leonina]
MKKVLCLAVAVGHMKMTDDELMYNIHLAVNFLVSLLKKNWQNIKSTMGNSQRLYRYLNDGQVRKDVCTGDANRSFENLSGEILSGETRRMKGEFEKVFWKSEQTNLRWSEDKLPSKKANDVPHGSGDEIHFQHNKTSPRTVFITRVSNRTGPWASMFGTSASSRFLDRRGQIHPRRPKDDIASVDGNHSPAAFPNFETRSRLGHSGKANKGLSRKQSNEK